MIGCHYGYNQVKNTVDMQVRPTQKKNLGGSDLKLASLTQGLVAGLQVKSDELSTTLSKINYRFRSLYVGLSFWSKSLERKTKIKKSTYTASRAFNAHHKPKASGVSYRTISNKAAVGGLIYSNSLEYLTHFYHCICNFATCQSCAVAVGSDTPKASIYEVRHHSQ